MIVEINISVVTTSDVPEQDRLADAVVRSLGESAGAGDRAAAIIEPISSDLPIWDLGQLAFGFATKQSPVKS